MWIFLVKIFATAVVGFLIYHHFKMQQIKKKLSWVQQHVQGYPLVGSVLEFKTSADILPVFMKYTKKLGGLYTIDFVHRPMIVATDTKFLEFLLTSHKVLDKGDEYKLLDRWLETGLLTAGAKKWTRTRKIVTPAFHFAILEKFVEVFVSVSNTLVQKLEKETDKDSVDIFPYIKLCALDGICESSLGVPIHAQDNKNEDYVFAVEEMCRIITERSFSLSKYFDIIYMFSKDYKKEKRYVQTLHSYTESIIKQRKKELAERHSDGSPLVDAVGYKRKTAFLDLLLQTQLDGQPLTEHEIRQEVDTFMFAGHDTLTTAVSFALYSLANHPDIQEKAFQEQKQLLESSSSKTIDFQELKEMKYLETVIKETLRLYPSVPIYLRNVKEDVLYEGNVIPKGTVLVIFAYGCGRNPEVFPEPEKFDPSRFDGGYIPPFSYIPFSAGPRNCIGQKYAMLQMKCIIGTILRNYELFPATPKHEIALAAQTVLISQNGIRIKLKRRNNDS